MNNRIIKLGNNTFIKGAFTRHGEANRVGIIDYPTIFKARGRAIRSGSWDSCTAINTPVYIEYYLTDKDIKECVNEDTTPEIKKLISNIQLLNEYEKNNSLELNNQIKVCNDLLLDFNEF